MTNTAALNTSNKNTDNCGKLKYILRRKEKEKKKEEEKKRKKGGGGNITI